MNGNRFMVDSSSLMIALFNGLAGGTKSTIDYAQRQGLNIVVITPLQTISTQSERTF